MAAVTFVTTENLNYANAQFEVYWRNRQAEASRNFAWNALNGVALAAKKQFQVVENQFACMSKIDQHVGAAVKTPRPQWTKNFAANHAQSIELISAKLCGQNGCLWRRAICDSAAFEMPNSQTRLNS